MRTGLMLCLLLCFVLFLTGSATAGPYPPAAGEQGSTAVSKDDPAFVAWATGWENYWIGADVSIFLNADEAIGKAEGMANSGIVCLGKGGSITLTFDIPIRDGVEWDFAVFENSFNDTFLELAYVEVSSDGQNFVRFDNDSRTEFLTTEYVDPTDIDGLAGKYRAGYGTPFDLETLKSKPEVLSGIVNLSRITHVRIVDIIGDGTFVDTSGDRIYDVVGLQVQTAGFDLDAIGVRYQASGVETAVDIKVNGSNDTVTVPQGTPVTISLAVIAGAHLNQKVDWWLVHNYSSDWLSFVATEGWVGGIKPVFQFPLFDLPLTAVFEVPDLPQGTHTFYFAIDNNADGIPDATWFDFVTVMVE
jgi:hypothetical protein